MYGAVCEREMTGMTGALTELWLGSKQDARLAPSLVKDGRMYMSVVSNRPEWPRIDRIQSIFGSKSTGKRRRAIPKHLRARPEVSVDRPFLPIILPTVSPNVRFLQQAPTHTYSILLVYWLAAAAGGYQTEPRSMLSIYHNWNQWSLRQGLLGSPWFWVACSKHLSQLPAHPTHTHTPAYHVRPCRELVLAMELRRHRSTSHVCCSP